MSVSASPSVASPPPPSPIQSSSSATPSMSSTPAQVGRHRSRPSFTIGYSQPPPPRVSSISNHGVSERPDPKSPSGTSSPPIKRPLPSSNTIPNPVSTGSQPMTNQPPKHFVVPAHPQSHHLHTIPPREKTTRTLILDHTAWRHGRTRLAQGRCELGMRVRFKNEEQAADAPRVGSPSADKRPGYYVGSTVPRRIGDFGDPVEVEIASSDEEGEYDEPGESDGEGVRVLAYGQHFRKRRKDGKREVKTHDRMEVDTEEEDSSGNDAEVEPFARGTPEDAALAPSLAVRATGISKVLYSMLAQPPSSPPRSPSPPPYALHSSHANSQHYRPPPPTQRLTSPPSPDPARMLPNGLRLRLALLVLVNGLFERQPPPTQDSTAITPDSSSLKLPVTTINAKASDPPKQHPAQRASRSPPPLPPPSLPSPNTFPPGLAVLAQISSQPFYATPTLPSFHTLTLPSLSGGASSMSTLSPMSGTGHGGLNATASPVSPHPSSWASGKDLTGAGHSPNQARRPPPPLYTWARSNAGPTSPSPLPASPRSATPLGASTSDKGSERQFTTSPVPQSFSRLQGPLSTPARSLPTSWKGSTPKALPDKSASSGSGFGLIKRARGRSGELYSAGCYASPFTTSAYSNSPANSFRSNVPTYSHSTGTPPTPAPGYPLSKLKTLCPRHLRETCTICVSGVISRTGPSTRIGAGLLKKQGTLFVVGAVSGISASSQSVCVLADLIPRFLRLSALVAMELGREARGEEPEANEAQEEDDSEALSSTSPVSLTRTSAHAQPTRAWFALLSGLLTRAVLEGYVAGGWKGAEYVEVLLGIGLGIKGVGTRRNSSVSGGIGTTMAQEVPSVEENIDEFEPDEMPRVLDASKVLFSGLVQDALTPEAKVKATRSAEEEYAVEMEERMSEFLSVPHASPDLATHLTHLSEKYPAEPVERAALRFCEAVAKWRGKPELEMYKRIPARSSTKSQSSTPAPLSINALLASTPTPVPRRAPIHKYFRVPPPGSREPTSQLHRTLKRQRSVDEGEREPKKEKVEAMDIDLDKAAKNDVAMQDSEWVGPYGV